MLCKYILKTLFTACLVNMKKRTISLRDQGTGPVQTSNFTCAEPNIYLSRLKLFSSTVDSDGPTLHVPNLIRGEKKHHPYCLK